MVTSNIFKGVIDFARFEPKDFANWVLALKGLPNWSAFWPSIDVSIAASLIEAEKSPKPTFFNVAPNPFTRPEESPNSLLILLLTFSIFWYSFNNKLASLIWESIAAVLSPWLLNKFLAISKLDFSVLAFSWSFFKVSAVNVFSPSLISLKSLAMLDNLFNEDFCWLTATFCFCNSCTDSLKAVAI